MSIPDTSWLEKLSENQQMVAGIVGIDNFKKLMDTYGGTYVYIPKAGRADLLERNEQIKSEFNGYNFRELALKYDLSEVWIRNIVSDQVKSARARPINGQLKKVEDGIDETLTYYDFPSEHWSRIRTNNAIERPYQGSGMFPGR